MIHLKLTIIYYLIATVICGGTYAVSSLMEYERTRYDVTTSRIIATFTVFFIIWPITLVMRFIYACILLVGHFRGKSMNRYKNVRL